MSKVMAAANKVFSQIAYDRGKCFFSDFENQYNIITQWLSMNGYKDEEDFVSFYIFLETHEPYVRKAKDFIELDDIDKMLDFNIYLIMNKA